MFEIISFRDLLAWQKAMDLADLVYELTEGFPKREWFGLAHQMRKAVGLHRSLEIRQLDDRRQP